MPVDQNGWNLSVRITLLPKDTNQHGTIFGGVILSYIDIAGAIEAKRFCEQEVVTVAMKEVIFKEPVFVGDLVSFFTRIIRTGRTSMTIAVKVITHRFKESVGEVTLTVAEVTYVAIDKDRNAQEIRVRTSDVDPPAFSSEYLKNQLQRGQ